MDKSIKTLRLLRNELFHFYTTLLAETINYEEVPIEIVKNVWEMMYPNVDLKKEYGISYKDIAYYI